MKLVEILRYARVPVEMNVKPGENVVVVSDTDTEPLVYESIAAAAFEIGAEVTVVVMTPRPMHGHEPPRPVAEAMKGADVLICSASRSLTHTEAVRNALKKGVKYVAMPQVTVDLLTKGAATADYAEVLRTTEALARVLSRTDVVRVTSGEGTDVRFSVKGRKAFVLAGKFMPGTIACFPDGEAPIAPVEGTAEGTIVFDTSIHAIGPLKDPVKLIVKCGRAVDISGGVEATALKMILERQGDANSYEIGEFAIGTNPMARLTGNVTEDKKGSGRVHFALGDNGTLLGKIRSKTHLDGVICKPTVLLDGKPIVEAGTLKIHVTTAK